MDEESAPCFNAWPGDRIGPHATAVQLTPCVVDHRMPIFFFCPQCGREIRVRSIFAGRKGRCVDCGTAVVVPDLNPVMPRHPPARDPAGESERTTRILESSIEIPTVNHGFVDSGEAPQETPPP